MKQQPNPMETIGASKAPAVVAETKNASRVECALVLSGGGPVGLAWMAGLVAGLLENDVDLGRAELIVGTSAGSIVGAQLALGMDVAVLTSAREDLNFLCIVEEQLLKITSNFALFLERVEGKQMLNEEVWKSAKSGQSTTNYSGLR